MLELLPIGFATAGGAAARFFFGFRRPGVVGAA
jgi:hypothetical protein